MFEDGLKRDVPIAIILMSIAFTVKLTYPVIILVLIAYGFSVALGRAAIDFYNGPKDDPDDFGDEPDQEV